MQEGSYVNYLCFTVSNEGSFIYDIMLIVVEPRFIPNCRTNFNGVGLWNG